MSSVRLRRDLPQSVSSITKFVCLAMILGLLVSGCGGDKERDKTAAKDGAITDAGGGDKDAGSGDSSTDIGGKADVPAKPITVLIFTKTAGFRHKSIAAATAAIETAAKARGWKTTATEDASVFSASGLKDVNVVAFVHTTGDVLDAGQQTAFEAYIKAGGGYVGVHATSDTEYSWKFYGDLVGAYFKEHTAADTAGTMLVLDRVTPRPRRCLPAGTEKKSGTRSRPTHGVKSMC